VHLEIGEEERRSRRKRKTKKKKQWLDFQGLDHLCGILSSELGFEAVVSRDLVPVSKHQRAEEEEVEGQG
jgi:hypothetical protein